MSKEDMDWIASGPEAKESRKLLGGLQIINTRSLLVS